MSMRAAGHRLKSFAAIAGLIGMSLAVGACTTSGAGLGSDITGSTRSALRGDLDQPMPATVSPGINGPYTPASDIGAGQSLTSRDPLVGEAVTTGTLPPVSSPAVTSTQTMTAQQSVATLQTASAPAAGSANVFYHTIESGESLYAIARRYSVTTQAIIEANGLESPDRIFVGQRLAIPGRPDLVAVSAPQQPAAPAQTLSASTAAPAVVTTASTAPAATIQPASLQQISATPDTTGAEKFRWPAQGRLIADFRASRGTGINIELPEGSPIHAVENGSVIYVGDTVEGYGNLVLIRHADGYVSAYAHLKEISVTRGQVVSRGDIIGTAGMTGSVTRPQLHFELRQGATPIDPLPLLAG
jgi:murein DD-endopeptidase MepM/ murein hydrolase activator NlpD